MGTNIIHEQQQKEAKNKYNKYGEANYHEQIVKNDLFFFNFVK